MNFKEIAKEKNVSKFLNLMKDIIYTVGLFIGKDITYDENGAFAMKLMNLMSIIASGDISISGFKSMLVDIFQFLNIPDEIGLFLTLL